MFVNKNNNLNIYNFKIKIKGLVQGVGFRPFIYRTANIFSLNGNISNNNNGVVIEVNCDNNTLQKFIKSIKQKAPLASHINTIETKKIKFKKHNDFVIKKSINESNKITEISPDIAVCDNCLDDMKKQKHRINYPFINCTNCGPRFSIIKSLPYDREKTSMNKFEMCPECNSEYTNVLDRRFHAQPVACNSCGPVYTLYGKNKKLFELDEIILEIKNIIKKNKIAAIKGIGGFHLMCSATNNIAVDNLRKLKSRDKKPFAVMFRNLQTLSEYAYINNIEKNIISSWRRPIVLLKKKKNLASKITSSLDTIGAMLPYMPLHYLIFETINEPAIILTSANISDEPIIIDNNDIVKLENKVDAIITYNREICNRTDDSVVRIINNKARLLRRSRSYTPEPIRLKFDVEGIFAAGAELVNCFAIGKDNLAILSQHIGDLKNIETYSFYTETIDKFIKIFRLNPHIIACDMHPDYLSSRYANELYNKLKSKNKNAQLIKVQHHHAHIASCMAENNINEKVIGVSFDGTGYGDDGNIWGGEFMICDYKKYSRKKHFEYIHMPGGDRAAKEPWRMAVSYLYSAYGDDFVDLELPFLQNIEKAKLKILKQAIDKNINSPLTSSAGRLFDAVASIIGLCQKSSFHAEAPMRLESIIDCNCKDYYDYKIYETKISFKDTIKQIVIDVINNISPSIISAKFHNTIISVIFETINSISKETNIRNIVMSGGTFQNKYISENIENKLIKHKYNIYLQSKIPPNDGGIALGQMAIAAAI